MFVNRDNIGRGPCPCRYPPRRTARSLAVVWPGTHTVQWKPPRPRSRLSFQRPYKTLYSLTVKTTHGIRSYGTHIELCSRNIFLKVSICNTLQTPLLISFIYFSSCRAFINNQKLNWVSINDSANAAARCKFYVWNV